MKTKPKRVAHLDRRQTDLSLNELVQEFNSTQNTERSQLIIAEIGFVFCEEGDIEAEKILIGALSHASRPVQLISFGFLFRRQRNSSAAQNFKEDSRNHHFITFLEKNKAKEMACCD